MTTKSQGNFDKLLKNSQKHLIDASSRLLMDNNNLTFISDFFVLGAAKRSITLSASIFMLVDNDHGVGALTLCRPHLDTLLRLHSLWLTNDPNRLVEAVFEGKRLDKLKDRDGNYLRDAYLVEKLESSGLPWVRTVYEQTNGYIHYSDLSMFQIFTELNEETKIAQLLIDVEHKIPLPQMIELKEFVIEVNREVAKRVDIWADFKTHSLK